MDMYIHQPRRHDLPFQIDNAGILHLLFVLACRRDPQDDSLFLIDQDIAAALRAGCGIDQISVL